MVKKVKKMLFIGLYPNEVDKYSNVFFQNLIFGIAETGVECTVISPVSVTKYKDKIKQISYERIDKTKQGYEVKVLHPRTLSFSSKTIFGIKTFKLTEKLFQKAVLSSVKKINDSFDVVYGHFLLRGGLAAIKAGRILSIPSFFAYGECDYVSEVSSVYGRISPKEIEGLKGIVSVSTKNTRELLDTRLFSENDIIMCPNGIDDRIFQKKDQNEARINLGLPLDLFIVGFVGGFIERKGDKRLLKSVDDIDDVYLAFAGKGENPPKGNRVIFCDSLSHEKVSVFLNAIDLFVLPTLHEGSSNAVIEAMACRKPVVSSNLPFNDDILDDSNSIRVNPTDIKQIREAILLLKNNVTIRNSLGLNAEKKAKELTITNRTQKILSFINSRL
ncbi:glycosyltransferase [Bacillus sp. CFBP 13597]|nr:glycosyltransferase [Bacillus sp. CFBP 13597]PRS39087.1 hypothetical protein C6W19_09775 [Bacillus sp. RJGP41]